MKKRCWGRSRPHLAFLDPGVDHLGLAGDPILELGLEETAEQRRAPWIKLVGEDARGQRPRGARGRSSLRCSARRLQAGSESGWISSAVPSQRSRIRPSPGDRAPPWSCSIVQVRLRDAGAPRDLRYGGAGEAELGEDRFGGGQDFAPRSGARLLARACSRGFMRRRRRRISRPSPFVLPVMAGAWQAARPLLLGAF